MKIGQKTLVTNGTPLVVGVLSGAQGLVAGGDVWDCDLVEVRLDLMLECGDWLSECERIRRLGFPVILTLRSEREGGRWAGAAARREQILLSALTRLDCIDVELSGEDCAAFCRRAEALGKPIIVSAHDFTATPPLAQLSATLQRMMAFPAAIPKIACRTETREDVLTLLRALEIARQAQRPCCLMGMGAFAATSRILLPSLGAALVYGYLDAPSAPGQMSAAELTQILRSLNPAAGAH